MKIKSLFIVIITSFFLSPAITFSSENNTLEENQVKTVQRALNGLGFYLGAADGIFGKNTLVALRNFYRARGMRFDEILSENEFVLLSKFLWSKSPIQYPEGAPVIISNFHSPYGVWGRKRRGPHQGIDIAGPKGQPILAAADGNVLESTVESCWGPTIVIDHGWALDGKKLIALYGHLGDMLVSGGEKVTRGQIIGRLGDNQRKFKCIGRVRHLHFQIGQLYRPKSSRARSWGHSFFLYDGKNGIDPNRLWADGPNRVTCFKIGEKFRKGTLTYPIPCQ